MLLPCAAFANGALDGVLSRLDASSVSFQAASANIKRVMHTAIINDNTQEEGVIRILRVKKADLRMRVEFAEPNAKSVAFQGRKAEVYYPKIKTVHEFDLGKHKSLVDQFLLLGFGTSGKELARSYSIKLIGQETVGTYKADRLELTPRSSQVSQHLKLIELWIHESAGYPVRQKFYEKSGDYTLIDFSDVKWNPALTPDSLNLNLPKDVKREYPNK